MLGDKQLAQRRNTSKGLGFNKQAIKAEKVDSQKQLFNGEVDQKQKHKGRLLKTFASAGVVDRLYFFSQTCLTAAFLVGTIGVTYTLAQTLDSIPPQEEPVLPEPLPPTEVPLETPPNVSPTPQESLDIPGTITVQGFEFVGSTVFSQEQLEQATAEFTGTPIGFAQLLQAAQRVTQLYLDEGYITSGAYIPSQELRDGVVTVQIVEGSLEEINVDIIDERLDPNYVRSRLAAATATPLNINRLQGALQQLQLNPIVESLNADLSAGTRPGTNILDVTVTGAETFNVQLFLDNNRNPSVGSFRRGIVISEANLLGIGDGISFAYSNTDGSDLFEGSYTLPLNARDGTLNFNFSISDNDIVEEPFFDVDGDGSGPDIEVDIRDFSLTYAQPVIQTATPEVSQELTLSLSAALRRSNSELFDTDFAIFPGADEQGETRLSVLRFAQEWLQRGRQQVFAARSQFSLGVGVFDATTEGDPDGEFLAWRGQLLYLRRLSRATDDTEVSPTLLLRSDVQLAADSLVSLEQFSLGGQNTVRGYRQNSLLTDNGILGSAEVRVPIVRVPEVEGTLQVAPFIDAGVAWNKEGEALDPNTLIGVGVGLLWQMQENFAARLDFGIPLVEDIDRGEEETWQENGVYFQVEYNFNPF